MIKGEEITRLYNVSVGSSNSAHIFIMCVLRNISLMNNWLITCLTHTFATLAVVTNRSLKRRLIPLRGFFRRIGPFFPKKIPFSDLWSFFKKYEFHKISIVRASTLNRTLLKSKNYLLTLPPLSSYWGFLFWNFWNIWSLFVPFYWKKGYNCHHC